MTELVGIESDRLIAGRVDRRRLDAAAAHSRQEELLHEIAVV